MCLVEPGGFRTDWGGASMAYAKEMDAYKVSVGSRRVFMQSEYEAAGDPDRTAAAIMELSEVEQMPLRQPLGTDATILLEFGYEQALAELAQTTALARTTDFSDANPSMTYGVLETPMGSKIRR
jgi:hypothetical protein